MLSNLKNTFSNPSMITPIPKVLLEALNKQLPKGFYYSNLKDDTLIVTNKEGKFSITAKSVIEGIDESRTNNLTQDELLQFSYNSQRRIQLIPDEENEFIINQNKKISASHLIFSFKKPIDNSKKLMFQPPKFPKPFPIKLSVNNISLTININRVPYDDLNIIKFESVENSPIKISYMVNISNSLPVDINIEFSLNVTKNVSNKIKSFCIYNALINGNALLNNNLLVGKFSDNPKEVPIETIEFWQKAQDLERLFNVSFDASLIVSDSDFELVSILYSSIIDKKPIKKNMKKIELTGKCHNNSKYTNLKKKPQYYFEYVSTEKIRILGAEIICYSITSIFNGTVTKFTLPKSHKKGEFVIHLEKKQKDMFITTQYFTSKEELAKTQKDLNHINKIFKEALFIKEIFSERRN